MIKTELREASKQALSLDGIKAFEKCFGPIKWLHGKDFQKKYAVIEAESGKVVYEADKLADIEDEFMVGASIVNQCLHSTRLLKGVYKIEKSEE